MNGGLYTRPRVIELLDATGAVRARRIATYHRTTRAGRRNRAALAAALREALRRRRRNGKTWPYTAIRLVSHIDCGNRHQWAWRRCVRDFSAPRPIKKVPLQ